MSPGTSAAQLHAERAVRGRRMFHDLLEAAPDGIVAVDEAGTIKLVNRKAEALFGYERSELLGRPVEVLVPERARSAHPLHRAHYLADPVPRDMNPAFGLAGRRKDGSEFPIEVTLAAITTEEGRLVAASVRDVTVRRQLEAQLARTQRLESVGQVAGGIAHDFNNLIAIILNYTRFALKRLAPADPLRGDVEEAVQAATRAAALTRQLLLLTRGQVGTPTLVDLTVVVRDLERLLRPILGEPIELRTRLAPDLWSVRVDPGQLEQVVLNLALNARDAMPAGGVLTLRAENLVLEAASAPTPRLAGPCVQLTVADTGSGMSPEARARAFEPFFTTKPRDENSGLGLAIVDGIVSRAGGDALIESAPGAGTTIRVRLPAVVAVPPRPATADAGRCCSTVLVVEDEPHVRALTTRILASQGYRVLDAADPAAALRTSRTAADEIDLLLTDVVLPEMSGRRLAGLVRRERPRIRVLYMSGYPTDVITREGPLDAPLLEKPFGEEVLLRKVCEAVDAAGASAP